MNMDLTNSAGAATMRNDEAAFVEPHRVLHTRTTTLKRKNNLFNRHVGKILKSKMDKSIGLFSLPSSGSKTAATVKQWHTIVYNVRKWSAKNSCEHVDIDPQSCYVIYTHFT